MTENEQTVEVLIRLARGNPEALGRLLERYRSFLLLTAKQQIGPQRDGACDASGIVQNTLAEACQGFAIFAGSTEAEFSAWLKSIHRHNLLDCLRRVRPEVAIPRDPDDTASFCWWEPAADQSTPSQQFIRGERALRLAELLESLPEKWREAVRLRHLEGWPIDRIAQHLERSVLATAGYIKRGLQELRKSMSKESWL